MPTTLDETCKQLVFFYTLMTTEQRDYLVLNMNDVAILSKALQDAIFRLGGYDVTKTYGVGNGYTTGSAE